MSRTISAFRSPSLVITLVCVAMAPSLRAGSGCPNWSSHFDGITREEVIRELRNRDWDAVIEQAGGPTKVIIAFKDGLKNARERLANAEEAVQRTAADENARRSKVTWQECADPQTVLMAAKCEVLNMSELIMTLQGSIELAECRKGR